MKITSSGSFLSQGEEDLMATLRKRDHAILKQEKKVEEMETWPWSRPAWRKFFDWLTGWENSATLTIL